MPNILVSSLGTWSILPEVVGFTNPGIMSIVQMGLLSAVVNRKTYAGSLPVYSTTRREALEDHGDDGSVKMTHRFEHQLFRRYGK